jgi:sialate O-acetylesterase
MLFNAMIHPLLPLPIKGVIWYQGESNNDRADDYKDLFSALIEDWRARWNGGVDFPFLYVQIAPYQGMSPGLRESQRLVLAREPNTAMTVTVDAGDATDIHPARKEPVGRRLALGALALAYGKEIEYSGPLYDSMRVEDGCAVIRFTHTGGGLVAQDGDLRGFEIAGADGTFVPAQARIDGLTVVVSSGQVKNPAAVRYGWSNVPDVNLFNKDGLPASPFSAVVK